MAPKEKVFIGTYTQVLSFVHGKAEGIYVYDFDLETGQLQYNSTITSTANNPSYVAYYPPLQSLFAVSEEEPKGKIYIFKLGDNAPEIKSIAESEGGAPCFITLNSKHEKIIATNYADGSFISYDLDKDSLTLSNKLHVSHDNEGCFKEKESEEIKEKYPHYERQTSPHCHHAVSIQNQGIEYVFISDLGKNSVIAYTLANNQFTFVTSIDLPKGSGPRHIAYNEKYQHLYVINELSGTISSFQLAFKDQRIDVISSHHVAALPSNTEWNLSFSGSALRLSASTDYLFASIRKHNSISVFKTNPNVCDLQLVQNISSAGESPRDINIHPSGKWLIAANQDSSNLAIFSVDETSDQTLTFSSSVNCFTPVCVAFGV